MRTLSGLLVFIVIFLLLDFYFYQAIRHLSSSLAPRWKYGIRVSYWGFSLLCIVSVSYLFAVVGPSSIKAGTTTIYILSAIVGLYIGKLVGIFPLLVDDLRRLGLWGYQQLSPQDVGSGAISRSDFLSWMGIASGTLLFGLMAWGRKNLYAYKTHRVQLSFESLPQAFHGLRIVQLSDIHAGSLGDHAAVAKGIAKVLALKPDLILFTGDLVNDRAAELEPWLTTLSRLKAPLGVYSVLGNHDYGDYFPWDSAQQKAKNFERLKQLEKDMGWHLLCNEAVRLQRDGAEIALLGVENWSARGNFVSKGDLAATHEAVQDVPFKILMSHDPSHWDAEVRPNYPDIALTLSGHTHGMQFGIENSWVQWSPVQWMYKQWAGRYREDKQVLYVNRGFGFIGYQGRVGIMPEITLITLSNQTQG